MSGPQILRLLRDELLIKEWFPIIFANYDVGRADAIWLWSRSERCVVHLDVICDPTGMGRLGICTPNLLNDAEPYGQLKVANARWRTAYRVSKDVYKAQKRRLQRSEVVDRPSSARRRVTDKDDNHPVHPSLLNQELRRRIFAGRRKRNGLAQIMIAESQRRLARLRLRAGRWIHLQGAFAYDGARLLADELEPAIPVKVVRVGRFPWVAFLMATVTTLKPKIFISYGLHNHRVLCRPDVTTSIAHLSEPQDFLLSIMSQLSETTFRRLQ